LKITTGVRKKLAEDKISYPIDIQVIPNQVSNAGFGIEALTSVRLLGFRGHRECLAAIILRYSCLGL
jgi:hypothetical protein